MLRLKHSGFSVHNKSRVSKDDKKGREAIFVIRSGLPPSDQVIRAGDVTFGGFEPRNSQCLNVSIS